MKTFSVGRQGGNPVILKFGYIFDVIKVYTSILPTSPSRKLFQEFDLDLNISHFDRRKMN